MIGSNREKRDSSWRQDLTVAFLPAVLSLGGALILAHVLTVLF